MEDKVLIIVPAYNEEKNIAIVVDEIKEYMPECDVLVINDCSLDETSANAKKTKMAKVIDLPHNLGIGGAVQTGFKYAVRNEYDYAVQVDGDGQHIPSEVLKLLESLKDTDCDMMIGSRFLDIESFRTSTVRRMGIKVFYLLYKMLIKTRVTDGTSGFRAYNKKCLQFLCSHYPDDYPEPEAVVLLKKNGFKICEVGVRMRERLYGTSSITPFKGLYYMIKVVLSIFFAYIRN